MFIDEIQMCKPPDDERGKQGAVTFYDVLSSIMKIVLIVIGVIAIGCVALELGSRLVAKRSRERFDKMSPDEQRKYQEEMYKRHQMGRICVIHPN